MDQPSYPLAPQQGAQPISANPVSEMPSSQTTGKTCNCGTGNCTCGAKNTMDSNIAFTSPYVYALV